MSEADFDLESLANYLHLGVAQVARLVERGKIPGRRVGGTWRFARPDIHHWMEERIGLSDADELRVVEGALDRAAPVSDEAPLRLTELLPLEAIATPLAARTRNSVISSMVELAARTGRLWDPEKMIEAVRGREEMHPTALECGVALLHSRRPLASILEQPVLALGRTESGIPFGGGRLTDLFFLICSVDDRGHLRALARLSRVVSQPDFLAEVRAAESASGAHAALAAAEARCDGPRGT